MVPFRRRMPLICSATGAKVVARLGAAPSISSSQARRVPVSLARAHEWIVMENGGLCGRCSRDLPLDRRLLFVAELTGQLVGRVGNAPTSVRLDIRFTGGPRSLRDYQPEVCL